MNITSRLFQAVNAGTGLPRRAICELLWCSARPGTASTRHPFVAVFSSGIHRLPLTPLSSTPQAGWDPTMLQCSLLHTSAPSHAPQQPQQPRTQRNKGLDLRQHLAEINALSGSLAGVRKLKDLRFYPKHEVEGNLQQTVQCINNILQDASRGPVKHIPTCLYSVSKAAEKHASLLAVLRKSPFRQQIISMVEAAAAGTAMYSGPIPVSQLCSVQYNLSIYCERFWQNMPEKCFSEWNQQAASNVVYAYGKLYAAEASPAASERMIAMQRAVVMHHAPELSPQGVGTVAWSLAKQGLLNGDILLPIQDAASRIAQRQAAPSTAVGPLKSRDSATAADMDPQALSNIMWAFATAEQDLGAAEVPLLECLSQILDQANLEKERVWSRVNPQDVANTLWACAKLKIELSDELRDKLMHAVLRVSDSMIAQGVANTWWAFATMKLELSAELRDKLMHAVLRVSDSMNAQGVANTWWAFAAMKLELSAEIIDKLMHAVLRVSDSMNAQHVANTLWACAKLKIELSAELRDKLLHAVLRVSDRMNAQDVANTLWAFATMKVELSADLRDKLMQAVVREADSMNAQAVANTLWGLAGLGLELEAAHAHLVRAVPGVAGDLNMIGVKQVRDSLQWLQDQRRTGEVM